MSVFRYGDKGYATGFRCDWCGKFANNMNGEYTKPDGISAGYIHSPDWDKNGIRDICEECLANLCQFCGSPEITDLPPQIPGRRTVLCNKCGKKWNLQEIVKTKK